jgi:hypothetical protein
MSVLLAVVLVAFSMPVRGRRGGAAQALPVPGRGAAPIDLTGYWVSVVTEDWRYRMVTPPKGDFASVPLNEAGRRMVDAWDPARDEANGEECKSYGVANIMRVPGRLHITWHDDSTLKIETDAGTQTRLLRFGEPSQTPSGAAGWQGYSVARWELAGPQRGPGGGGGAGRGVVTLRGVPEAAPAADAARGPGRGRGPAVQGGSLRVVTTRMKAGYLRKNGVPYSERAVVTEYFDRHVESNGEWFTVTTIVDDPTFLDQPFITSTHFKKEADASKWHPTACTAR